MRARRADEKDRAGALKVWRDAAARDALDWTELDQLRGLEAKSKKSSRDSADISALITRGRSFVGVLTPGVDAGAGAGRVVVQPRTRGHVGDARRGRSRQAELTGSQLLQVRPRWCSSVSGQEAAYHVNGAERAKKTWEAWAERGGRSEAEARSAAIWRRGAEAELRGESSTARHDGVIMTAKQLRDEERARSLRRRCDDTEQGASTRFVGRGDVLRGQCARIHCPPELLYGADRGAGAQVQVSCGRLNVLAALAAERIPNAPPSPWYGVKRLAEETSNRAVHQKTLQRLDKLQNHSGNKAGTAELRRALGAPRNHLVALRSVIYLARGLLRMYGKVPFCSACEFRPWRDIRWILQFTNVCKNL